MSSLLYHSTTIIYCKIFEWDRPIQKNVQKFIFE